MPRATSRQRTQRYDELLEKAAQLIADRGYGAATLEQIAASMDMSGPAIYYYVKSKDELLYEIWKRAGAKLQSAIDEIRATDAPASAKLNKVFHRHLFVLMAEKPIFEVLILQRSQLPEFNRDKLVNDEREYVRTFAALVEDYLVETGRPANSKLAALGAIAMLNAVLRWYDPEDELSLDDIAEFYFSLFTAGVGTGDAGRND